MFIQIPVSKDSKKALVKWKDITITPDLSLFKDYRIANITGNINNIIVIDVDKPKIGKDEKDGFKHFKKLMKNNKKTLTYKTKSGGMHYYFEYDEDINTKNIGVNGFSIDVLTNNNYAIVYDKLYDEPIQTMPDNVKEFIMSWRTRNNKTTKDTQIKKNVIINKDIKYKFDNDKLVKLLNLLPSKYYNDYKCWFTITSALKSANLKDIWVEFSKKSSSYDCNNNNNMWDGVDPKIDLTYMTLLAQKENIKTSLKIHKYCDKLNIFTAKPNEIVNDKYINLNKFDFDEHPNLLIKSATGTGKTTATSKLVDRIRHGHDYKVLSIVSRVSLAYQHQKNFENMQNYKDLKQNEYSNCKDLVIQLDSIIHLNPQKLKNTIVYLDEVNSMFEYMLNSSTLKSRRLHVFNMLCMIIANASYVIGVDADLSDIVLKFFKFFDIDVHIIHNKYKNANGKVTDYKCPNKLISNMKANLKKGEKFICCFDSLTFQDEVIIELKRYCESNNLNCKDDFLIYSSKDGEDNDLTDVTATWKGKYVFYTPKIVYGIDFVPDEYMNVYAFFKCTSVSPLAFSQMVSRCRKIKHLKYNIQERNVSLMFMDANAIKENYDDVLKYLENCIDELDPINKDVIHKKTDTRYMEYDPRKDEIIIATSIFDDMYWEQQYYNSIMRSSMNQHFKNILEDKGYVVNINEELGSYKINSKELKGTVKENNIDMIDRIINDKHESLTASEIKVKTSMEKRASILHIKIDNDKFREELADDKKFREHLSICSLLYTNHDEKFIDKAYQELKVKNTTSNITKVKLINDIHSLMNISPLCIDNININIEIPEDKQNIIKKVFRIKDIHLITLYRNLIPGLISSNNMMIKGVRTIIYNIDSKVINHHLDLLQIRNKKMDNVNQETLKYFDYVAPKEKKMF
jgi:hypothetical protein